MLGSKYAMVPTNMNYYYEIASNTISTVGIKPGFYCLANCSPAQGGTMDYSTHDVYYRHSERVWLENANGVTLIKAYSDDRSWGRVDPKEFVIVKLRARAIDA